MIKIIIIGLLLTMLIDLLIVFCTRGPYLLWYFKESYPSVIFTMFLFSLIIWLILIREKACFNLDNIIKDTEINESYICLCNFILINMNGTPEKCFY